MGGWLVDKLINGILDWFAKTILGALNALWDLLSATVFVSPDVTQLPQVTAFASTSLGIVNACYVLAFLWMAIMGLANAFTAALTSQNITAPGSMQQLRATTISAIDGQTGANAVSFLLLLIGLLIAVLVGILVVQWIIRLGVLVVAVGIAPIALALHGTPQTEGAAKLWWRTILGTLGTVVMQAVALHTTLTIFLNPDANLPVLGLPGDPSAVGMILRVVLVQQLTRGISRAFGSGRGAARAAPTARPAARGASRAASGWPTR